MFSLPRSRRVSLSTVTGLTDAEFCVRCFSLTDATYYGPAKLVLLCPGLLSFPMMTSIGWKAAGTFN